MKISFVFKWLDTSTYFCDVFVAHYKIAISNFDMKTSHIVVYVILFKKLCETNFWTLKQTKTLMSVKGHLLCQRTMSTK